MANVLIGHVVLHVLVALVMLFCLFVFLWPAQGYGTLAKLAFIHVFCHFAYTDALWQCAKLSLINM